MKLMSGIISLIIFAAACGKIDTAPATGGANVGNHDGEEQWLTSLPDALTQAKKGKKLVLVDFTGSDWCPPCKMLHDKVLTQKEFLDHASENLVLVMLDFPRGKEQAPELKAANGELAKKYDIQGFPTLVLLDSEGNELAREVGLAHQNPAQLITWVKDKGPK